MIRIPKSINIKIFPGGSTSVQSVMKIMQSTTQTANEIFQPSMLLMMAIIATIMTTNPSSDKHRK